MPTKPFLLIEREEHAVFRRGVIPLRICLRILATLLWPRVLSKVGPLSWSRTTLLTYLSIWFTLLDNESAVS